MPLNPDATAEMDHPLAIVECMARRNNWEFLRTVDDEITLAVAGKRTNYQASFSWMEDIRVLHFACAFKLKVPSRRLVQVRQLLGWINEQLWIGHFDVWDQSGVVMFRHALLLIGGVVTSAPQCEAVLGTALDSCERYFPALQYVVWSGKSAREAIDAATFETAGEAIRLPAIYQGVNGRLAEIETKGRTIKGILKLVLAVRPEVERLPGEERDDLKSHARHLRAWIAKLRGLRSGDRARIAALSLAAVRTFAEDETKRLNAAFQQALERLA